MVSVDVSPDDLRLFETLVSSLKSGSNDLLEKSSNLLDRSSGIAECMDNGVSLLTTKSHLLLGYIIDLVLVSLRKCSGSSINGCLSVSRLIEARTYLEKMKPIDYKLKYQIDKLLKIASTGGLGGNDALLLKANPDNLASKLDEADDSDAATASEAKLYKPPKLTAAYYADTSGQEKMNTAIEKAKKRALSSSIMQDLRQEYYDGPEEIVEAAHVIRGDKALAHKRKYEEENFVRLSVSKSERQRLKRMQGEALGSLTRFEDISVLTGGRDFDHQPLSAKNRSGRKDKGKQKRGKANKFKRRK